MPQISILLPDDEFDEGDVPDVTEDVSNVLRIRHRMPLTRPSISLASVLRTNHVRNVTVIDPDDACTSDVLDILVNVFLGREIDIVKEDPDVPKN